MCGEGGIACCPTLTAVFRRSDVGEPLVRKVIEGVSGCVFAYGATGTGKSYAVLGEGSQPGLAPRMVTSLFRCVSLPGYKRCPTCVRVWTRGRIRVWGRTPG